jgi:hypothetical protein
VVLLFTDAARYGTILKKIRGRIIALDHWQQCCGSGMYYSGSDHFLIPDPNIFSSRILDPAWKVECQLGTGTFYLVLMLSGDGQKYPGSGKNSSRIRIRNTARQNTGTGNIFGLLIQYWYSTVLVPSRAVPNA